MGAQTNVPPSEVLREVGRDKFTGIKTNSGQLKMLEAMFLYSIHQVRPGTQSMLALWSGWWRERTNQYHSWFVSLLSRHGDKLSANCSSSSSSSTCTSVSVSPSPTMQTTHEPGCQCSQEAAFRTNDSGKDNKLSVKLDYQFPLHSVVHCGSL